MRKPSEGEREKGHSMHGLQSQPSAQSCTHSCVSCLSCVAFTRASEHTMKESATTEHYNLEGNETGRARDFFTDKDTIN